MKKLRTLLFITFSIGYIEAHVNAAIYIPVKANENSEWFFVDEFSEKVSDQTFNYKPTFNPHGTFYIPTIAHNGIFSIVDNGDLRVYAIDEGKINPLKNLRNLYACGIYADGMLPVVRSGGGIIVTDGKGNEKFDLDDAVGKPVLSCNTAFSNGMLVFTTLDGVGAIDKNGKVIVEPTFDGMSDFNENIALAWKYAKKTDYDATINYYIVDTSGNQLPVEGEYSQLRTEESGYHIPAFKNGKVQVLDLLTAEEGSYKLIPNIEIHADGTVRHITHEEYIREESPEYTLIDMFFAERGGRETICVEEQESDYLDHEEEFSVPQIHANTPVAKRHVQTGELIMGEAVVSEGGWHFLFVKGGRLMFEDESGIHYREGDGGWERNGKAIKYLIEGTDYWSIIGNREYQGSYNPQSGKIEEEYWNEEEEGLDNREVELNEVENHPVIFQWYAGELE